MEKKKKQKHTNGISLNVKAFAQQGSHKHNRRKYFCKWCNWQGLNFQNIPTVHITQYPKNSLIKKWAEDLNRHFSKEDMHGAKSTWKGAQHH